jgi:hypothetical protein
MLDVNLDTLRLILEAEFAKRYERLVKISQSNVLDFATWDKDGMRLRPLSEIDPARLVALKTYSVRQTRHRQHVKIALHDKLKACRILTALHQAHGKPLDQVGVVVGEAPVKAASPRPSACVTRAQRPQTTQLEDMTELAALFKALNVEWPEAA